MKFEVKIYNEDGSERWKLVIKKIGNRYKVFEDTKYSLFNCDEWEGGKSPGEALDNFLKVEKSLIDSLL